MIRLLLAALLIFSGPAFAGVLDIKEVRSKSGITAWLVEDHTIPVIAVSFAFRGSGSVNDPPHLQGLSRILSNTLDEGAGDIKSEEFQRALTDYSINLSFNSGRDDFGGNLKTLSKNKAKAFQLLELALTKPRFDDDAVQRMIAANLSNIRNDMTDPNWMATRLNYSVLFKNHPYAMNSGGTLTSLPKITPEDLQKKLKSQLTRDRLIVSVSGDISAAELGQVLDDVFSELPAQSMPLEVAHVILPAASIIQLAQPIPQTIIHMTLPGIQIGDPDYFSAQILNFILGQAGFGSRLTDIVREKNGLTYGIYTNLSQMDYSNIFSVYTSTRNETTEKLIGLVKQELQKIKTEAVTEKEIAFAQSYLIGSVPLSLTSTDQIAGMMLGFQRYNLPPNYLDIREKGLAAVTPQSVQKAAQRIIDFDHMTTILIGNPQNIKSDQQVTELENVK